MRSFQGTAQVARPAAGANDREISAALRNVVFCYFLSGSLGLIYQVLWLRKLLLVFGSTVHAVSTILTVFFGGLALGSWLFGRLIDRRSDAGLRWYGFLEIGVGVYAFLTPLLFEALQHVYIPIYRASDFSESVLVSGAFICAALILIVPTTLLGGTFPVLSRFLVRSAGERGVKIASLYAINTAGAMCGVLFVYYIGLPMLGLFRTLACAGVLNIGLGLLCLIFDAHLRQAGHGKGAEDPGRPAAARQAEPAAPPSEDELWALRWLLAGFALSGAAAMICEVAWTRALSLVVGSSIYAFCIMLATYLGGIAFGSWFIRRRLSAGTADVKHFIMWEGILCVLGLLAVWVFAHLSEWFVALWPLTDGEFRRVAALQFVMSALAMLPSTIALGILFPIVSDVVTRRFSSLGQRLGTAYAVNTLGGIIGSFLAGFVLIPMMGLPVTMILAAILNLMAGGLVLLRVSTWATPMMRTVVNAGSLVGALLVARFVLLPAWHPKVFTMGVYLNPAVYQGRSVRESADSSKLLYYRDSLNATVSVHERDGIIFLKVGGKPDASTGIDMGTQVLSAHIPLLHHANPDKVLVIGLGSGVTLGHAGRHPASMLHCAELDPAVIEGARFFHKQNYDVHDDPRTRMFAADGRNVLLASPLKYDVIISEPSNPWMAGLAYLFTKEFYGLAKNRLAPGGIMCQWLQLYNIFPSDVKLMLKTFHDTFPHVTVWTSIPGDLLLVGSMEPHALDMETLRQRMNRPGVPEAMRVAQIDRAETLLELLILDGKRVEQLTGDITWVHEDDQPTVEFNAPKSLYAVSAFSMNYNGIMNFKVRPETVVKGYDPRFEDAAFFRTIGQLWMQRDDPVRAIQAYEKAVELEPDSSETLTQLGGMYLATSAPVKAERVLRQAIAAGPMNGEAHRLMGQMNWYGGQLQPSLEWYLKAAKLMPMTGELASQIGSIYQDMKQPAAAAECYRSAFSLDGGERFKLVRAFSVVLRDSEAWRDAEQVAAFGMEQFPREAVFPLVRGQALTAQQEWDQAERWLLHAVGLSPKSADPYRALGRLAVRRGDAAQAARWFRQALRVSPYDKQAAELLSEVTQP